jgi:hypothetical protein
MDETSLAVVDDKEGSNKEVLCVDESNVDMTESFTKNMLLFVMTVLSCIVLFSASVLTVAKLDITRIVLVAFRVLTVGFSIVVLVVVNEGKIVVVFVAATVLDTSMLGVTSVVTFTVLI